MFSEILIKLPSAVLFVTSGQQLITYSNTAANELFSNFELDQVCLPQLLANDQQRAAFAIFTHGSDDSGEFFFSAPVKMGDEHNKERCVKALVMRSVMSDGTTYQIQPIEDHALTISPSLKVALYDPLTNLPNRAVLRDRMEQAIRLVSRLPDNTSGTFFRSRPFQKDQ